SVPPTSPPMVPPTTPPSTPPSIPPPPKVTPTTPPTCDIRKLSVCVDLLDIFKVVIGGPRSTPCCQFINGLVGLDASVCVCAALKANVLGVIFNLTATLQLLLNQCGHVQPANYICR
ncbi:proline-rich protein, partial [Trifolium pratense]